MPYSLRATMDRLQEKSESDLGRFREIEEILFLCLCVCNTSVQRVMLRPQCIVFVCSNQWLKGVHFCCSSLVGPVVLQLLLHFYQLWLELCLQQLHPSFGESCSCSLRRRQKTIHIGT
jgi:hypothetical protein